MAGKKATRKRAKWSATNPSPAQLRARRAFARMAKARSKAARLKKRGRKNPTRKVAVARKRNTTVKIKVKNRARKNQPVARKRATVRRRRNDGAAELAQTFSGLPQDHCDLAIAPEGTPDHVVSIGDLLELKTSKEKITFEPDEATLAVDAKEKLHILTLPGNSSFDSFEDLGRVEHVVYGADKDDGSGYQEYQHDFGEEGGTLPTLATDREGMLHIKGGSYVIDEVFTNPMRSRRRADRRSNIEQGFYAGGTFHPIRASSDYSPSRAGEGSSPTGRLKRAKKKAAPRRRKIAASKRRKPIRRATGRRVRVS